MGKQVASIKTPATTEQMRDALTSAWIAILGDTPTTKNVLLLMAHWELETGGGNSMIQYNVGNFKGRMDGGTGNFTVFRTFEFIDGVRTNMDCPFRAYESLDDGCQAYLKTIHGRFTKCWEAVLSGDPVVFSTKLREQGYYTAPLKDYISGMTNRFYHLCWVFNTSTSNGTDDFYLSEVQSLGFDSVVSFQTAYHLTSDGVIGPVTKGAIIAAIGAL